VGPAKVSPRLPYLARTGKLENAIILRQTNLHQYTPFDEGHLNPLLYYYQKEKSAHQDDLDRLE